jgi:NAD(P)-dependent dehydrogenase (short-subunit alcohol dehydrogenase family)
MKLKNKVIIVTGGSGLIGNSIINFLINNAAIVINADINCNNNLDNGEFYCDINDPNSTTILITEILKKFNKIDGLVNCAYPRTKDWGNHFEDSLENSWKSNIDMQMNSNIFLMRKVIMEMKNQLFGSIVNIASIYGVVGPDFSIYEGTGMGNVAEYAAIKGGIINVTRYLASFYGKYNIRINCVSPGGVFDNQNPQFVKNYENKVPLKRMANPDDISPMVGFLLSDDTKYITGQNIMVDGGWTCI